MKTIRLNTIQVKFPTACPVCLGYPHQTYKLERTFTYGRQSIILSQNIPFCRTHYKIITTKTTGQRWCERLSPILGLIFGGLTCFGLLRYWSATEQGTLLLNLTLALFIGISMGFILWLVGLFWVTPLFAAPETKQILRSVQMTNYDPFRQVLELTFTNETAAELTARENLSALFVALEAPRCFRISAHMLDHDIRYNGNLQTHVLLNHAPTPSEALDLLKPVIDKVLVQQLGVGTFYDIDNFEIEEVNSP
jgi:preprotein translocase subunit Sec61beta